ncbi:MAG TPA: LytR C-terminal domain-containing protein [Solirubrobacterales bacterium]
MKTLIHDVGAYAGIAAFIGLAVLSLLYFAQARDVRRLREWAGSAPERDAEMLGVTSGVAAERDAELQRIEEERRRREQAQQAEAKATAYRETRRQRREAGLPEQTRWERFQARFGVGPAAVEGPSWRSIALIALAVIVLGGGVAVAALAVFGGGNGGKGSSTHQAQLRPSDVEVAVLNGTAVPGLAARFGDQVEHKGFKLGAVTNSNSSFSKSVVEYRNGFKPEAAKVSKELGIDKVRPMSADIAQVSAGASVSVVIGDDKAAAAG